MRIAAAFIGSAALALSILGSGCARPGDRGAETGEAPRGEGRPVKEVLIDSKTFGDSLETFLGTQDEKEAREALDRLLRHEAKDPGRFEALVVESRTFEKKDPGVQWWSERITERSVPAECFLSVPPGYDPSRPWPLILALHGKFGTGKAGLDHWPDEATRKEYLVLAPTILRRPDPKKIIPAWMLPENALWTLTCLSRAAREYRVDPDRVFVDGHSLGGTGAFEYAVNCPHLFAGAVVRSSFWARFDLYPNLEHLPLFYLHGEKDQFTTADHTEGVVQQLGIWAASAEYVSVPGRPHHPCPEVNPRILEWMKSCARLRAPDSVTLRIHKPSRGRRYWLEARGAVPGSEIRAERVDTNHFEMSTLGVSEVVLHLDRDVDFSKPVTVVINNKTHEREVRPSRRAFLEGLRASPLAPPAWAVLRIPTGESPSPPPAGEAGEETCQGSLKDVAEAWKNWAKKFEAKGGETESLVGRPAPVLKGDAWFGSDPLTNETLRGKVFVVDFWAPGPSGWRSVPHMMQLARMYEGEPIVFIGVCSAPKKTVKYVFDKMELNFIFLWDPERALRASFKVLRDSTAFLVDRGGIVRWQGDTFALGAEGIDPLLEGGKETPEREE
ncbi:MAG: redoxin domain-containing protein [Planctomycetota bacterium]|jgi:dienelactone hydrolase